MTNLQEQAIKEITKILNLHFDSFILTTKSTDETMQDAINTDWHGSLSDVVGLVEITKNRLMKISTE